MDCLVGKEHKESLVVRLHSEGVVEVEFLDDGFLAEENIPRDKPLERFSVVSDLLSRAKRAVEHLNSYWPEKTGFLEGLLEVDRTEKIPVKRMSYSELVHFSEEIISPAERSANSLQHRLQGIDSRISELKSTVDRYLPFKNLGLDSKYFEESPFLHTVVGILQKENVGLLEEGLYSKLESRYLLVKLSGESENVAIVAIVLKEDADLLEDSIRKMRLNRLSVDVSGKFDDILANAELDLNVLSKEKAEVEESFSKMSLEYKPRLHLVAELLEIEKQKCEVFARCGSTENTILLRLWTPQTKSKCVENLIEATTEGNCAIVKTTDLEDAPVLLDNPQWVRPFESLTKMFSLPRYNQLDPTLLLAPTFILFFGMMFSDFIYGVILILAAFLLHRNYGRYSNSIKDASVLVAYFGFSSMFFGLLTGSFLGDFAGKYIFGNETGSQAIALWLDPLYNGNMMTYIPLVFAIGFAHVFSGYFFGAYDALRRRQYKAALLDYVSLMLFPIGLILYATKITSIGLLLSAGSLLLVFLGSGIMGLYLKVSGMLGNVVSYARLLALMASSSGIAMAINFLASMSMSIPYFGLILSPLVFIAGHIVNLGLNMLGSFVHTLRLHYVEFFGTFYEGGGVEFTPFTEDRRYSKIVEEVK